MITLNDLFRFDDLLKQYPGKRIKLRFNTNWKDQETKKYYDFVDMYQSDSPDFEPYILSIGSHGKKRNKVEDIQFQFIEVESHKWLFVGAYNILEESSKTHTNINGITFNFANAFRISELDKYKDRLIVDWINKPQSFFYTDRNLIDNVKIDSILKEGYFETSKEFPGFENLSLTYQALKTNINNPLWRENLSNVYAVYVITDMKKGKLYVGSATGEEGVFGRFSTYLKDGYDKLELEDNKYPNVKLKELVTKEGLQYIKDHFKYTILEIFPKNEIGKIKALTREVYFKEVLLTKVFGYNAN